MSITPRSFSRTLALYMGLLVALPIGLLGGVWIFQEYSRLNREADVTRARMLAGHKEQIKKQVEDVAAFIRFKRSQTEERLRTSIRARVNEAHALASHLYATYQHDRSAAELKEMIREALRPLRYDNDQGYYFITSLDGIEMLFADRPELEGKNLLDLQDTDGAYVIRDMIAIVRKKGEGFYSYNWTRPGHQGDTFRKISYIKHFAPFDWFIGTGAYQEDMETAIRQEVAQWMSQLRFGRQGYVFAGQWDGLIIAGPGRGENILQTGDARARRVVGELIDLARTGGGHIYYEMPEFADMPGGIKSSYVLPVEDWHWYIGAGELLDDIDIALRQARQSMRERMEDNLVSILVVLASFLAISFFIAHRISRKTYDTIATLTAFFERAASGIHAIDPDALEYTEFQRMAAAANRMVAERNRVMEELAVKEERYRSLFESASDAIIILQDGHCLDCNAKALHLFGVSREQMIDARPEDFSPAIQPDGTSSRDQARIRLRRTLSEKQQFFEWLCKKKDGTLFEAEVSLSVLRLGGTTLQQAIVRDISARKQAERQLVRLASAIEQAAEEIVITDNSGVIGYVNPAFTAITGYDAEEAAGQPYHFLAEDNKDPRFATLWETIQEGTVWRGRLTGRCRDGRSIEADSTVSPIVDAHGERMGYVFVMRDVTEQLRVEAMFRQSQKMEAIGTLAGGIAHDFNNILAAIFGFAEIARLDVGAESRPGRCVTRILEAAGRARDLVKQILAFSRRTDMQPQPIQPMIIAKETMKLLKASLPSTIVIRSDFSSESVVVADPTSLHQIIMNLCANAAHAMGPDGGILDISLIDVELDADFARLHPRIVPGPFIRLTVSDTGHGMTAEMTERIFEPFFTTKGEGEGTGMGLAVVHGIVQRLGGTITVHSELGMGSSFAVYLPRYHGQPGANMVPSDTGIPGGTERILFVDDEELLVDVNRQILEMLGYRVAGITDSREALAYVRQHADEIDLLITDYTMPGMTGITLAIRAREIRPDLPVLLCTGFDAGLPLDEINRAGIRELILKPINRRDLANSVRRALQNDD
ncbi:MAG: cache domain-containing protein [Thermodesulfobacteriota bacterium]